MLYYALTLRDGVITGRHESVKPITMKTFDKTKYAGDEVVPQPDGFKAEDDKEARARRETHDFLKGAVKGNMEYLKLRKPTDDERDTQITKLTEQMIRAEKLLLNDIQEA